ncbi:MAG: hypothetical protein EOP51_35180 [Sphingobacteriales bacterium]|nr:MAG: hypothetical protein EOP51_35180 [Sphingobacteriales bacterium]
MAVSYNKKHALQGVYPDLSIDYPKVLVAQGRLREAENAAVVPAPGGLKFTWNADVLSASEKSQRVMMMAYLPDLGVAVYNIQGATRVEGADVLAVTDAFATAYMETYISFISIPGNDVADSVYTGSIHAPE